MRCYSEDDGMYKHSDPVIIRLDARIEGINPAIFRILELPRGLNFAELHEVLQAAFGWTDSHLHQFILSGLTVGAPEVLEDGFGDCRIFEATEVSLGHLRFPHGADPTLTIGYEYDFGDSWQHVLTLRLAPREDGIKYPRCIDGARACPPEDVGGRSGYADFLAAWLEPNHEDHKHNRHWAGRKYDPERFDLAKTNKAITSALRAAKGDYRARYLPSVDD